MLETIALDPALAVLADRLVGAARRGPGGAYWAAVPVEERTGADAARDRSLATGTPGIALFLAAYARHADAPVVRALLGEVEPWIAHALRQPPLSLGYYQGYGGLVAAALRIDRATGSGALLDAVTASLAQHHRCIQDLATEGPVGLDWGLTGLLLALLGDARLEAVPTAVALAADLAGRVVGRARRGATGCHWDRLPDSVGPSAGFAAGNAGVEYVLALLAGTPPAPALTALHREALAFDETLFDARTGNWRDTINRAHYADARRGFDLGVAARRLDPGPFRRVGETISWSAGTAGVLVSRALSARTFGGVEAPRDVARAWRRLEREWPHLNATAAFTLEDGWGGVAASLLRHHELTGEERGRAGADTIAATAREQVLREGAARALTVHGFPRRGFLNGEAGVGYLLLVADGREREDVLFPRVEWQAPPPLRGEPRRVAPAGPPAPDLPGWFLQATALERRRAYRLFVEDTADLELDHLTVVLSPHVALLDARGGGDEPARTVRTHAHGEPVDTPVPAVVFALLDGARREVRVGRLVRALARRLGTGPADGVLETKLLRAVRWCLQREFLTITTPF